MSTRRSRSGPEIRTPSSAMLVQMLFVLGAVGTGVVGALVTWLGPRRDAADVPPAPKRPPSTETPRDE